MKTLTILLLCLLSFPTLRAQTGFGKATPQTADFIKYGNMPVSLYTGQITVSVPLYRIEDPDFDIPFVLNYAADGLKPAKRPGWAGLNWSLSGAGVITREVYGAPDDFKRYTTTYGYTKGFWEAVKLCPYSAKSLYSFASGTLLCHDSYCELPMIDKCYYDCEPDLFVFSMPGHNGRFMIDNQGNVQTTGKGYKVDLTGMVAQQDDTNLLGSQIKITSPDGYVYTFGSLTDMLNSQEYSINFHPEKLYTVSESKQCINAWHLTSIVAPNGRKLKLNYTSLSGSFGSPSSHISSRTKNKSMTDEDGNQMPIADPYKYQATKIALLKSIEIPDTGFRIEFESTKETCRIFYSEFWRFNQPSYQLSGLNIIQNGKTMYTCGLEYENKKQLRFLKRVTLPDKGEYLFDYLHPNDYPEPSTEEVTEFGYSTKYGLHPYGLMNKVTYPTKGYTFFTYEPHSYNQKVFTEVTSTSYTTRLVSESDSGNGFRIKKIEDMANPNGDEAQKAQVRTYTYATPQQQGSGILLKGKVYVTEGFPRPVILENFSWNGNYNIEEPHIGYSYVKETFEDNSFVQYSFSDYSFCPDKGNVAYHWSNENRPTPIQMATSHATLASSKWEQRGYLLQKLICDNMGRKQQKITYAYRGLGLTLQPGEPEGPQLAETNYPYIVSMRSIFGGITATRLEMTTYPLMYEQITEYGKEGNLITTQKWFTYNNNNLLSTLKERTPNNDTLKTTFTYPQDHKESLYSNDPASRSLYAQLVNKNILNRIIEEKQYFNSRLLKMKKTRPRVLPEGGVKTDTLFIREAYSEGNSTDTESNYEWKERYPVYDNYGNPVHVVERDRPEKVLIWGYGGRYLIAEIEGMSYVEVANALRLPPESFSKQTNPDMSLLNALRSSLAWALVTTYTYEPLVGMTSCIAPNGEKRTFQYNSKGELISEKNHEGQTVKEYTKHYKE